MLTMNFPKEKILLRIELEELVSRSPLPLQFYLGDQARIEVELDGKSPTERLACAKNVLQSLV